MEFALEFSPELLIAFLTLFVLEIVLGVDNVIFISILAAKLPVHQQARARNLGLSLAMITRIGLLFGASWIITLTDDLFAVAGIGFSGRDLILIGGGLFLIYKAVKEIHHKLEGEEEGHGSGKGSATFVGTIIQILLLDIVFSFDSVITAVGMVDNLLVIITAVVLSFGIMLFSSKYIFAFVNKHPSVKLLALAFLVMIGAFLIADGFGYHVDKALIYVPMAFGVAVEALNLIYRARQRKRRGDAETVVPLRETYRGGDAAPAKAAAEGASAGSVTLSRKPVAPGQDSDA